MLDARAQWGETRDIASVDILATGLSITPGAIDGLTASCHDNSHFILLLTRYKMSNQSNFEIHRLYIFLCLLSLFVSLLVYASKKSLLMIVFSVLVCMPC